MKITSLGLKNVFIQFIFSQNPWLLLMEIFFLWLVNNPRFKTAQSNMNQNVHGSMNQSVSTLEVWWVLNIKDGLGNTRKSLNCLLSIETTFWGPNGTCSRSWQPQRREPIKYWPAVPQASKTLSIFFSQDLMLYQEKITVLNYWMGDGTVGLFFNSATNR